MFLAHYNEFFFRNNRKNSLEIAKRLGRIPGIHSNRQTSEIQPRPLKSFKICEGFHARMKSELI
jgi:hypothetical protein